MLFHMPAKVTLTIQYWSLRFSVYWNITTHHCVIGATAQRSYLWVEYSIYGTFDSHNGGVISQKNDDDGYETLATRLLAFGYVVPYTGSQIWLSICPWVL
jgi:hypothetical protein